MMARLCPAGMIFVPSVGGLSHNVREHTKPEHLQAGAAVLLHAALRLSQASYIRTPSRSASARPAATRATLTTDSAATSSSDPPPNSETMSAPSTSVPGPCR